MYTAQKNNKKLKALYEQSLHIKSAIPHPLIMGVIRGKYDCGGWVMIGSVTCQSMGFCSSVTASVSLQITG